MAITAIGAAGTGTANTSGTSVTFTASATLEVGNTVVLCCAKDNTSTTDGETNEWGSVTDATGNTWTKLKEHCKSGGSAASGVTGAIYISGTSGNGYKLTNQIANGGTISIATSSVVAKAVTGWEFTSTNGLEVASAYQTTTATGSSSPGSQSISGLASGEYLYLRLCAVERENVDLTPTTNYTEITGIIADAGGSTDSIYAVGEFRIPASSTSNTSNPSLTQSPDSASIFVAFKERAVVATGTLAATEGADTAAIAGDVHVRGTVGATDAADVAAFAGDVYVQGALAATEAADTAAIAGDVLVQGALAATEAADTAAFAGDVYVQGTLVATEGTDTAAFTGQSGLGLATGTLAATEAADTAAFAGDVYIVGSLAASEASDSAAVTGLVRVIGSLGVTEEGADQAALTGGVRILGTLAATEAADTYAGTGFPATPPSKFYAAVPALVRGVVVPELLATPVPALNNVARVEALKNTAKAELQ
jgi:hypothetical protein